MDNGKIYMVNGQVLISVEEYNKINMQKKVLRDREIEIEEKIKQINKDIDSNMFMSEITTIDRSFPFYHEMSCIKKYDLSESAKAILKPIIDREKENSIKCGVGSILSLSIIDFIKLKYKKQDD